VFATSGTPANLVTEHRRDLAIAVMGNVSALAEARRGAQLPFPCNIPVDVLVEIVSESKTSSSFIPIFQSGKTSQELKKEITFQHQE